MIFSRPDVATALFDAGVSPTSIPVTPSEQDYCLYTSCSANQINWLRTLGCNPDARNSQGESPLHHAASRGDRAAAQLLIESGAPRCPRTDTGETPLHLAAIGGHTAVVKFLLVNIGIPVGVRDNGRNTPLHSAAAYGRTDAAQALLDNGASVRIVNFSGHTPLRIATWQGHLEIARLISRHKA